MLCLRLVVALAATIAMIVSRQNQARAEPTAASQWASGLKLEDPTNGDSRQWSRIPANMVRERQSIMQEIDSRQSQSAVKKVASLLDKFQRSYSKGPGVNSFLQSLYMAKMKAEAIDRQYFMAMLTGCKFSAYCAENPCDRKDQVERLLGQIENQVRKIKEPGEVLGLSTDELNDRRLFQQAKIKLMRELEPRRLHRSVQDDVTSLKEWAEEVFEQLEQRRTREQWRDASAWPREYERQQRENERLRQEQARERQQQEEREQLRRQQQESWRRQQAEQEQARRQREQQEQARRQREQQEQARRQQEEQIRIQREREQQREQEQRLREERRRQQEQQQQSAHNYQPPPPRPQPRPSYTAQPSRPQPNSQSNSNTRGPSPVPTNKPRRPVPKPAAPAPAPKAPVVKLDASMKAARAEFESLVGSNSIDEAIQKANEFLKKIEAAERMDKALVSFLQEVFVIKINAELKNNRFLEALHDTARFLSVCETQTPGKCSTGNPVRQLREEIEKKFEDGSTYDILGLDKADWSNAAKLKKGKAKAVRLLHPDKNRGLNEEQTKYSSHLFDRANTAFNELLNTA